MKKKITHANTLAASKNLAPKVDYILPSADVVVVFVIGDVGIFTHQKGSLQSQMLLKTNLKKSFTFRVQNKVTVGAGTLMKCPFSFPPLNKYRMTCDSLSKPGYL